jgi:small subunit ribosomal protein S19
MARSLIKGPFVAPGVTRAFKRAEKDRKKEIKIWSRSSVILSSFIGKTAMVHNGKKFVPVSINEVHVGRKFGEFSPTKVQVKHPVTKAVKGNKRK